MKISTTFYVTVKIEMFENVILLAVQSLNWQSIQKVLLHSVVRGSRCYLGGRPGLSRIPNTTPLHYALLRTDLLHLTRILY